MAHNGVSDLETADRASARNAEHLDRGADKEVLLFESQFLALVGSVIYSTQAPRLGSVVTRLCSSCTSSVLSPIHCVVRQ